MTAKGEQANFRQGSRWRLAGWGGAALLLTLPFMAMQVTDGMNWGAGDFILFALLVGAIGGAVELMARGAGNFFYRGGACVAVAAAVLLVLVNMAVGILGSEDNPANLMFFCVIAVALAGSIVARFRAAGMARAMVVTAAAQALIGIFALAAGLGSADASHRLYEVMLGTGLFGALWLLSAWLFRKAADPERATGAERP